MNQTSNQNSGNGAHEQFDLSDDNEGVEIGQDGGDHSQKSGSSARNLPPAQRVAVKISLLVDKLQEQLDIIKGWDGTDQETAYLKAVTGVDFLKDAAVVLTKIPHNWRPGKSAPREVGPGSIVKITGKRYPLYQDVISAELARGIRVDKLLGNSRLLCTLTSGLAIILPRGHVAADTESSKS